MLVDSDLLIWYLRGNQNAKAALERLKSYSISAISYMEVVQGLRNKTELKHWKHLLKFQSVQQILIDHEITAKAAFLMEEYSLSHRIRINDALIAATANVYGLELFTGNYADYKYLPGLNIRKFKA